MKIAAFWLFAMINAHMILYGQTWNMSLCTNYDNDSLPFRGPVAYNDVWGYVTSTGKEIGIFGSVDSVYFFEVMPDCSAGLRRINVFKGGYSSIWRDFKTYSHYAYAVADEGSEGLMVFDLQYAPDSILFIGRDDTTFNTAHNVFIDTARGHLFLAGAQSNHQNVDLMMYDLHAAPAAPKLIKKISLPGHYVHDVHVYNDTAFCSHGYNGMYIYALDSVGNFNVLSSITTYPQQGYNHSSWVSKNRKYLVFADETHNTSLKIYDISNIFSPKLKSLFRSALLAPKDTMSIVHNPFIRDDNVFLSYYHDGVQIFNISDPTQPQQIAYYDTEPGNTDYNGYQGAWGVYPYLPSGRILASDISHGFFVMNVDFTLDLELIELNATRRDKEIELNWNLVNQRRFRSIMLQRSHDQFRWFTIYNIGDNPEISTHRDPASESALNFYRILAEGEDGKHYYSNVIKIKGESAENMTLYQCGQSICSHNFGKVAELSVSGLEGRVLLLEKNVSLPFRLPDGFKPGIYVVEALLEDEGIRQVFRFVK
ncbi:MAG TPA: choice-of-anchor B family protein [Saprospiraceae bacterium]|nr:choice-of-anchor B family protein [Saprospiraceae bacterium]HMX89451.1 choice-of-anchor B family protein [Saprospiraceae bacterium]